MRAKCIFAAALTVLLLTGCGKVEVSKKVSAGNNAAGTGVSTTLSPAVAGSADGEETTTTTTKKRKKQAAESADEAEETPQEIYEYIAETQPAETQLPQETPPPQETQPPAAPVTEQAEVSQPAVTAAPTVTVPPEVPADITPEVPQEPARANRLSVNCILQKPELPTGCEVTSLAMLLNYLGYNADKVELSRNHLPKMQFYYNEDGALCGADFRSTFVGDPESEYSYGCYAPCIVTAANSYLSAVGAGAQARDITGTSLEELFDRIDSGSPVLIWITADGLAASYLTETWLTPEGYTVQWRRNEHCAVLTGYDCGAGVVYVSDPLYGNTTYDMSLLRTRYGEMGCQCVVIE